MHCGSDVMGSMLNHSLCLSPPREHLVASLCAEFTAVLLLLNLFWANLSQILLSLHHIILSVGLRIARYLITRSLPTFLSASYTILLLAHFITASGLSWLHMPPVLPNDLSLVIFLTWSIFLSVCNVWSFILQDSAGCHLFREAVCALPVLHGGFLLSSLRPLCSFIL